MPSICQKQFEMQPVAAIIPGEINLAMNYEFKYRKYAEALYDALQYNAFYITMEKSIIIGSSKEAMIRYMDYSIINESLGIYQLSVYCLSFKDKVWVLA